MDGNFRIDAVYRIVGIGVVIAGSVTRGQVTVGMTGTRQGYAFQVKTIEHEHQQIQTAEVGDKVGMSLRDGDFALLEAAKGQEIQFSDTPSGISRKPEKGFFARLFGR